MSIYSVYFSPTGGTRRAARMVAGEFEGVIELDLCNYENSRREWEFNTEDICMISVPSFGGRVPAVAAECLSRMKGGGARTILTAVYGNRDFDDTLLELRDCTEQSGFRTVAAIAAVAEHSIIHEFGTGRPDRNDEATLRSFACQIRTILAEENDLTTLELPGNYPYREYHGVPFKPVAGAACTVCGRCAKECPVQAIPEADPAATENEQCISCMRCIVVCPQQARQISEPMVTGAREKMKASCTVPKENQLFTGRGRRLIDVG